MILTTIKLSVDVDGDYAHEVSVNQDEMFIEYQEMNRTQCERISFGSLEEMEAVARAMLKAVQTHKQIMEI